jgi:hypothetical protein
VAAGIFILRVDSEPERFHRINVCFPEFLVGFAQFVILQVNKECRNALLSADAAWAA